MWFALVGVTLGPSLLGLDWSDPKRCVAGGAEAPSSWQPASFQDDPQQAELRSIETEIRRAQRGGAFLLVTRLDVQGRRVIVNTSKPDRVVIPEAVPEYAYCLRRSSVPDLDIEKGAPLPP